MRYTWIFLADNDHRSGTFAGETEAAHIGGSFHEGLELCSLEGPPIAVARSGRSLIVEGRHYRTRGYWPWVGNWCWSGYALPARSAARLLQQLRAAGYSLDSGVAGFWGVWERRRALTAAIALKYGGEARGISSRARRSRRRGPRDVPGLVARPGRSSTAAAARVTGTRRWRMDI